MCFSYGNVCLQFSSVAPHVGLCHAVDCSTQGLPVHHQLPLTQTHDHLVCDAIVPSNPVIPFSSCLQHSPGSGSFQMSQFFHQVAELLEFQLQHQSFQWIFRNDFLLDRLVGSPCSPRDSQESSPTPQFKSINSLVLSLLYSPTLTSIHDYWRNHTLD